MGVPVVVTVKDPALPSVKVALSAEVMAGGPSTVRVKDWVASGVTPLEASMVKRVDALLGRGAGQGGRAVPVVGEGHPGGQAPVSDRDGVGVPVVVTVKDPALPSVKVALSPEVMVGAPSTVRVKVWVASGAKPLAASMVKV